MSEQQWIARAESTGRIRGNWWACKKLQNQTSKQYGPMSKAGAESVCVYLNALEAALTQAQAQAERDEAQTGYRIAMDCVGSMEAQLATAQANCDALTAERDALRNGLQAIENAGSLVYGQQAEYAIGMARSTLAALTPTPTATTQQGQE